VIHHPVHHQGSRWFDIIQTNQLSLSWRRQFEFNSSNRNIVKFPHIRASLNMYLTFEMDSLVYRNVSLIPKCQTGIIRSRIDKRAESVGRRNSGVRGNTKDQDDFREKRERIRNRNNLNSTSIVFCGMISNFSDWFYPGDYVWVEEAFFCWYDTFIDQRFTYKIIPFPKHTSSDNVGNAMWSF